MEGLLLGLACWSDCELAMATRGGVFRNLYRDLVSLMQLGEAGALEGVGQASAVMATAGNLALLREAGLALGDVEAGANDLLVALDGEDEAALAVALAAAEADGCAPAAAGRGWPRRMAPRSWRWRSASFRPPTLP